MNRYRAPGAGPSKATASTLCQKCHYSYECKATSQDRPYVSRPSRTQQLFNPKLQPKLTSDVPQDLLRKKGVADEELARREKERRGRRSTPDERSNDHNTSRRRRSSSASSASVSTISTNLSRSPSPATSRQRRSRKGPADGEVPTRKRRRSSASSMDSYHSGAQARDRKDGERNTRRRYSDASPRDRGRRRNRSPSSESRSSYSGRRSLSGGGEPGERGTQTKPRGHGSQMRRDARDSKDLDRAKRSYRSRSRSPYKRGDSTRMSRSRDGYRQRPRGDARYSEPVRQVRVPNVVDARKGFENGDHNSGTSQKPTQKLPPPRERSLSPFSKRLALTQAMNMGR